MMSDLHGEKLWAHQLAALHFLRGRKASLLDLMPGSGKSRIFVEYVTNYPDIQRALILCPKSFAQGWKAQFEKHGRAPVVCACLDASAGTVPRRVRAGLRALVEAQQRNLLAVVVVNYDVCWRVEMVDFLLDAHFDVVGFDEIQRVRGAQRKVSRFAHRLSLTPRIVRIGFSGTPFPETPLDSFGVCRALDASLFGTSYLRYRSRYAIMGGFENRRVLEHINQGELWAKINTLRFTMEPKGYDLPSEQDIVIPLVLPEKVRKLYRRLKKDLYAQVATGEITLANAATAFSQLQRLCSGFVPVENVETGEKTLTQMHTVKQDALTDLLESLPSGQSLVVMCRFHCDLAAVHIAASAVGRISAEVSGRPGRPPAHIDGGVWVGPETVLAVQGASGVEGLDLTRSHTICYYSYVLELGKYTQSRARIRRAGQTSLHCTYYHLVVQGGIDEKIRCLLEKKQHVLQGLFDASIDAARR